MKEGHELTTQRDGNDVVLEVEGLCKKFCRSLRRSLVYGVSDIATELVGCRRNSHTLRDGEFWALRDLSFEVRRGESLALVGPNGSGKTTLLRIIAGLIKPDAGSVRVRGVVAPLISLGAGFSPVLTGRENIYANMAILGLSTKEIDERYDGVIEFAEIADAIDAPLRTYSSGMAARLGFACAIHADPDIFLIDEVLAVGDLRFRLKCYRALARLRAQGTSFVLVSHNPQLILANCDSGLYLRRGRLHAHGDVASVLRSYENELGERSTTAAAGPLELPARAPEASSGLDIVSLSFTDEEGSLLQSPVSGEPIVVRLGLRAHVSLSEIGVTLLIKEQFGEGDWLLRFSSATDGQIFNLSEGEHEIRLKLPYCGLRAGNYTMKLNVAQRTGFLLDVVETFHFLVEGSDGMSQCRFYQPRSWELATRECLLQT